jgi:histidine triad (HIT) family protein
MSETIFDKLMSGEFPCDVIFEDDNIFAFRDINPQAKVHLLFIHKLRTTDMNDLSRQRPEQLAQIFAAIEKYTKENGLEEKGFRVVSNLGAYGRQTVFHTHFHVLGGEPLGSFGS